MNVNAYPLPNRSELLSSLRTHQANGTQSPLIAAAASCLDEFKSESGERLVQDLQQARSTTSLRTALGVAAGGLLAALGLGTGLGLAGVALGAGVAGMSLWLGARRQEKLDNFGLFIGAVNLQQVVEGKFDAQPQPQSTRARAEAQPMPDGWKNQKKPQSDIVIDTVYDPSSGSHVAHTIYEFPRPPQPEAPQTRTVIDMKPDARGTFVMDRVYES
ncbi:MAG: hypothetical protein AMXMBFR33_60460 [Candidatus Xenobia bacterium]